MTTARDLMAGWIRRRGTTIPGSSAATDSAQGGRGDAGEYRLLYKYLRDRYADKVVLTFAEIEDLLGFPLPEPARLQREWWGGTEPIAHRSAQSASWTLARRTATVNLSAQRVVFERLTPQDARPGR